jgi:Na+-translocating ferredoxin:NAD+ oxidoreductase RnfC subunit
VTLLEQVFAAGVVGAGGAGFPTHKKLGPAQLLVVNGAECEPLLASDRYAMRHHADAIVAGARAVAGEFGIRRIVLATKRHYTRELAALEKAAATPGQTVELFGLDSFYPAGDEQSLIFELTGRTVPPGGLPLALGIVVVNVTTALNLDRARAGTPVTRRLVTVTGEVAEPQLLDVPVGTTAADLIRAAGGTRVADFALVKGGPMMGRHFPAASAATLGFGKADGGLIVLAADHPLVTFAAQPMGRLLAQTQSICIQCSLCTELCPRYLIGHRMRPHRVMRAVQSGQGAADLTDALLCCECGICELYACPMGLSPRRMNQYVKGLLRDKGIREPDRTVDAAHAVARPYRKVPQARLIERLCLDRYPTALETCRTFEPDHVNLPLRHGVGRPAAPRVSVGDHVTVGQVVAGVEFEDVGCLVHASIPGRVTSVGADAIVIERDGKEGD